MSNILMISIFVDGFPGEPGPRGPIGAKGGAGIPGYAIILHF